MNRKKIAGFVTLGLLFVGVVTAFNSFLKPGSAASK